MSSVFICAIDMGKNWQTNQHLLIILFAHSIWLHNSTVVVSSWPHRLRRKGRRGVKSLH